MPAGRERAVAQEEEQLGGDAVGGEGLVAHDEEEAGEDGLGDEVEDEQEGAGHGAEREEALREVGDALLDDVRALEHVVPLRLLVCVGLDFRHAEGFGVEWGLGDEAVGEGEPEDAGDAGGQAEEEEVPVEAGRFAQGELGSLRDEGGDCKESCKLAASYYLKYLRVEETGNRPLLDI